MTIDPRALVRQAAAAALNAQAEEAQTRTRDLAPKESRQLEQSIRVEQASASDLTSQVYTDSEYALYQHEAMYLQHDDGQAKFMESAVTGGNSTRALEQAAAREAKRYLG